MEAIKGETRFVGGAVRNTLQNLPPEDIDLATTQEPEDVLRDLKRANIIAIPTGLSHGTITAVMDTKHYEITTLRTDHNTDGRHAEVQYTTSWVLDAQRRDFTMNALYVDGQGHLYDPLGQGVEDALKKRVCFIGNPKERLQEDYLRLLRYFRFCAFYGAQWHQESLKACLDLRENLRHLSKERITKEILRLCSCDDPWTVLEVMMNFGVLSVVFNTENLQKSVTLTPLKEQEEKLWALSKTLGGKNSSPMSLGRLCFLTSFFPGFSLKKSLLLLSRQEEKFWTIMDFCRHSSFFSWETMEKFHHESPNDKISPGKKQWLLQCGLLGYEKGHENILWGFHGVFLTLYQKYGHCTFNFQEKIGNILFQGMSFLEKGPWPDFPIKAQDVMDFFHLEPGPTVGKILQDLKKQWVLQEFPEKNILLSSHEFSKNLKK